jgi:hypothetical protein
MIWPITLQIDPAAGTPVPIAECQNLSSADSTSFPVIFFYSQIFQSFKYSGMTLNKNAINRGHSGE